MLRQKGKTVLIWIFIETFGIGADEVSRMFEVKVGGLGGRIRLRGSDESKYMLAGTEIELHHHNVYIST